MAHTGPRTTCTPLNYHIGLMNTLFVYENGVWVYHGEKVTPAVAKDIGDFVGGLNSAYQAQYPGVPFPTDPDSGNPPPVDPIASFKARQAVSQNCAWVLITPTESNALRGVLGDSTVSQYNNFYTVGGSGGLGVQEQPYPMSPSGYVYVDASQKWANDVNQAADKRVQELADDQGRTVPPPVSV